jgi:hypothetical protein
MVRAPAMPVRRGAVKSGMVGTNSCLSWLADREVYTAYIKTLI